MRLSETEKPRGAISHDVKCPQKPRTHDHISVDSGEELLALVTAWRRPRGEFRLLFFSGLAGVDGLRTVQPQSLGVVGYDRRVYLPISMYVLAQPPPTCLP